MLLLRSPFVCYKLDEVIVAAAFPYCASSCRNTEQSDQLFRSLDLEEHSRRIATSRLPHLRHLTESEELGTAYPCCSLSDQKRLGHSVRVERKIQSCALGVPSR